MSLPQDVDIHNNDIKLNDNDNNIYNNNKNIDIMHADFCYFLDKIHA